MAETFDYDVFLSYSSKDGGVIRSLAERLRAAGLRVWLDTWVIQPGDPVSIKIQHGLETSRVLLMCMSKAYFASDWARLEHHSLLFRDPTNRELRFIPILIEDCDPPHTVAQFAYVDWREPSCEAYEKLLKACRRDQFKGEPPDGPEEAIDSSAGSTMRDSRPFRSFGGHDGPVMGVAVIPDGSRAISGSADRTLKVWDLANGRLKATFKGHSGAVNAVVVTSDGKRAISGSDDGTVHIWDLAGGWIKAILGGHGDAVHAVAVTPDGTRAISGAWNGTVHVWYLAASRLEAKLAGHGDVVTAVAVTPDGTRAISGSADRTLKVWDLARGRLEAVLEGHDDEVNAVAVTPDGTRAISGSDDIR